MEEIKTKICSKCGEEKPLTKEFWYFKKDGNIHSSLCKHCHNHRTVQKRILARGYANCCQCGKEAINTLHISNKKFCSIECISEYKETKQCPLCKKFKPNTKEYWYQRTWTNKSGKHYGLHHICKQCDHYDRKDDDKRQRELLLAKLRNKNKPEQYREQLERNADGRRKAIDELKDWYVEYRLKKQLTERKGIEFDITQELIHLKREQIKAVRLIKKAQEALQNGPNY